MDAWKRTIEINVLSKEGKKVIPLRLVNVIDDNNAIYRGDEPVRYGAIYRKEVEGNLFVIPEADFDTLEEAEMWIKRICEECGEQKLIRITIDQETLWGDEEEYYPPGSEGWLEMDFDFCGGCGHVQGAKVHLS
ncbi:MAG: hypothetical protein ABSH41_14675 [Syntrophobacteraceae bacterium]|jgi:hypothetical protein